jgi:tellurite methyltransferase
MVDYISGKNEYGNIERFYDRLYGNQQEPLFGKSARKLLTLIFEYKKSGDALDLGCGDGRCAIFLAMNGFSATGIDISREAIKKARIYAKRAGAAARFISGNLLDAKVKGKFDVIVMYLVMHHLKSRDKLVAIKKIMAHTKSDGINFIAFRTDIIGKDAFEDKLHQFYKRNGWEILKYSKIQKSNALNGSGLRYRFLMARKPD